MAILIRKNQNIKGLCINDKEHKLFQYAYDTGIFDSKLLFYQQMALPIRTVVLLLPISSVQSGKYKHLFSSTDCFLALLKTGEVKYNYK